MISAKPSARVGGPTPLRSSPARAVSHAAHAPDRGREHHHALAQRRWGPVWHRGRAPGDGASGAAVVSALALAAHPFQLRASGASLSAGPLHNAGGRSEKSVGAWQPAEEAERGRGGTPKRKITRGPPRAIARAWKNARALAPARATACRSGPVLRAQANAPWWQGWSVSRAGGKRRRGSVEEREAAVVFCHSLSAVAFQVRVCGGPRPPLPRPALRWQCGRHSARVVWGENRRGARGSTPAFGALPPDRRPTTRPPSLPTAPPPAARLPTLPRHVVHRSQEDRQGARRRARRL